MNTNRSPGTLFVVATPLGNLQDLSPRATEILGSVAMVAAEDTRRTGRLLSHLGIHQRMVSCHDYSNDARTEEILGALGEGDDVALVSDAGTPLVSDPGFELVRDARRRSIPVIPIPGACAVTAALSVAGLPTDRFMFCGFPPAKPGARRQFFAQLVNERATLVFFESSHRIRESIADMDGTFGSDREAFLGREMTKLHEQYEGARLGEMIGLLDDTAVPARGEFVVVVAGSPESPPSEAESEARRLLTALVGELPPSRAARVVARLTGVPRGRCYEIAEEVGT